MCTHQMHSPSHKSAGEKLLADLTLLQISVLVNMLISNKIQQGQDMFQKDILSGGQCVDMDNGFSALASHSLSVNIYNKIQLNEGNIHKNSFVIGDMLFNMYLKLRTQLSTATTNCHLTKLLWRTC